MWTKWGASESSVGSWMIHMYISLTCLIVLHVSSLLLSTVLSLLASFAVRLAVCKQKFLTFSFLAKNLYLYVRVCVCVLVRVRLLVCVCVCVAHLFVLSCRMAGEYEGPNKDIISFSWANSQ